jgi:hypothetical protein
MTCGHHHVNTSVAKEIRAAEGGKELGLQKPGEESQQNSRSGGVHQARTHCTDNSYMITSEKCVLTLTGTCTINN